MSVADTVQTLNPNQQSLVAKSVDEARAQQVLTSTAAGEGSLGTLDAKAATAAHPYLGSLNDVSKLIPGATKVPVAVASLPAQLGPFNTGYIAFGNGVPVGSQNCALTIFQNGNYSFTGSFHDSGATSYNGAMSWVITTKSGVAFSFSQSGHMAGTFESGSRDWSFNASGNNAKLAAAYKDLCANYHWRWQAAMNLDLGALVTSIEKALAQAVGVALQVVSVVGPLLA